MDFIQIMESNSKKDGYIIKASPLVGKYSDLMIRGGKFYAVWDEANQRWSRNLIRLRELIDEEIRVQKDLVSEKTDQNVTALYYERYDNGQWQKLINYLNSIPDSFIELDRSVKFSNDQIKKEDYSSFTLSYPLLKGSFSNYDKLMNTLYDPEERMKLEWCIGSIFDGDSRNIQKFVVLYGDAGSGKSTFIKILQMLFEEYAKPVETKALGYANDQFSMEPLRDNPLVAFQDDGDLSHIEDNTKLNSIISHERMIMREKHKSSYPIKFDTFMFIGSNSPVRITDAKSGLMRRLIDVSPSGRRIPYDEYEYIMSQIPFELSGIAWHCIAVYRSLGRNAYDGYIPIGMILETNPFYNFIEDNYFEFKNSEYVTLDRVWGMYKQYCEDSGAYRIQRTKVRDQLKSYFDEFYETKRIDGSQKRKVYVGFKSDKFITEKNNNIFHPERKEEVEEIVAYKEHLELNSTISEVDEVCRDFPAQYASEQETPLRAWDNVTTTLGDLDTTKLHYILFPEEFKNHIVIDFDLKDADGNKSAVLNLEAASKWPATYAEFSKGGAGVHLHYIYDGDPSKLSAVYAPGIEIKVFSGKASLRRKLSKCNDLPIAHLSSGLPLKEEKKVVNFNRISSERGLRDMINRNLRKEIHPATKPSVDFIYTILEDAYNNGLIYDIRDMRPKILAFAASSSHQSEYCIKLVAKMKFCSDDIGEPGEYKEDAPLVVYDIEVFPNLLIVCWKYVGKDCEVVRMFNPSPNEIERLFAFRLVSFNGSDYDAHIMYARYLGWSNMEIYKLSQNIINSPKEEKWKYKFKNARSIEYVDVHDFASNKQSLKKWEIQLHIHHQESEYPWDEPLPEDKWEEVGDYCANDVRSTEILFDHLQGEFIAREILADLAGMPVNTSTNALVEKILFQGDKNPALVYTDFRTGEQWTGERKWYNEIPREYYTGKS